MEQKNENDSSKHLEGSSSKDQIVQPEATSKEKDPFPLNHDKIIDVSSHASSCSSSSSQLELESYEKEENRIRSPRAEPDAPPATATSQWSMVSGSPRGEASTTDMNSVYASPKQSPAIQVMGRPAGYDPNRIPSSVFCTKPTTPTDWSVASNESLFSIQMGNNSFSTENLITKSGELGRPDDWLNYQCFVNDITKSGDLSIMSTGLPTVMETTAENERKSASTIGESVEREELLEAQDFTPINCYGTEKEKPQPPAPEGLQLSSHNSSVSDGKGGNADGTHNSSSTHRLSNESGTSASSFAFPVFEGGGSMKAADSEKPRPPPVPEEEAGGKHKSTDPIATRKAGGNKWFSCFTCCPICRS